MNALAFDTHKAVKTLQQAGAEEPLAEAVVATIGTAMGEQMATKADLGLLRTEMGAFRKDVAKDMEQLRKDMEQMRAELIARMDAQEQRLMVRLGTLMVTGLAVLTALMQLF